MTHVWVELSDMSSCPRVRCPYSGVCPGAVSTAAAMFVVYLQPGSPASLCSRYVIRSTSTLNRLNRHRDVDQQEVGVSAQAPRCRPRGGSICSHPAAG
ncbi:hypothetical protein INR49_007760 [Caranx melampygus]|nr:hypothetical protein INR49_007760 [Caranx melampygus]